MLVSSFLSAALAATATLAAPQQIPLGATSSAPSRLASLISPTLGSAFGKLESTLAALPVEHLVQLEEHVNSLSDKRLVQFEEDGEQFEITEGAKALLTLLDKHFVDVTDDNADMVWTTTPEYKYPSTLSHNAKELKSLFKLISIEEMKAFIAKFSSFFNRYYRSNYGLESQQYLLSHLKSLHKQYNPSANITFREFKHSSWDQKSIIVRWAPSPSSRSEDDTAAANAPPVILSAHQDSTNSLPFLRAPGADDDGSGTTALVQAFTALLKAGGAPTTHPVELHLYSAEEGGLLGSGEVARSYMGEGKQIRAMYHMDVVAYVKPGTKPVVGLITDGVNDNLTDFMELLINEYAQIPVARTRCGYACSDHGSWTKTGSPSACLSEGRFEDSNPNMHSSSDVFDRPEYSFEHIEQFVRIALGYITELAGFEVKKEKA
ncbi:hypothetical protein JCM11251_005331 [Rhodosporidiobolus azoricus]